ncbi:MAG: class I SAM-dependent methyltransferase [Gemmatimonadota bacterium]|jgi:predicted O-methyltransferase YrrM
MKAHALLLTALICAQGALAAQEPTELDARVRRFLDEHERSWRDANVPMSDGQALYDIVVEHGYTRALEIGTSTGHSAIWIAWALSKTGGKLITIEVDEGRHRQAVRNFEEAGLSEFINARLADAHELVPALPGPYDFIFMDADKDWYSQYFRDALPKLEVGGCFTAHNVSDRTSGRRGRGRGMSGTDEFVELLKATPNMDTEFVMRGGGLSVSYKSGG